MADRYWVGGTAIWDTTAGTKWATTSGGAGGASVPTVADSVFFDQAATYTVTMTGALACLNMNVTAGTVSFITGTTPTLTVAGNWSTIAGTVWSQTGTVTFTATTAKTINTNGITISSPFTFNGTGGSWTLQNDLTLASTATTTLTAGTLALVTYTLSTGLFASASAVARTINFGTGKIVTTSATTSTVWNTSTITNLTISGTSLVECQGGGTGVTKTISPGALTTTSINFSLLETTGTVTYTITTAASNVKNLLVNGSQTLTNSNIGIFGEFTHLTTNGTTTFTAGANAWIFAATSGSYNINNIAGFTYDFPWTFGSSASTATWTIANNLTLGATRVLTFNTGTLDWNNKTLTGASGITQVTGSFTLNNTGGTTFNANALAITHTSGNLTLGTNLTTTAATGYTLTAGTLNLNNFTLSTSIFVCNSGSTRSISFGTTGQITLTGNNTTILSMAVLGGFTYTGTPRIYSSYSGATGTRTFLLGSTSGALPSNVFDVTFNTSNTGLIINPATDTVSLQGVYYNADFTNLTNTVSNDTRSFYGNFTVPATGGTFTAGANVTNITAGITVNIDVQRTLDFPININSSGGTFNLLNNFTIGSTRTLTLTTGTIAFNTFTITTGLFSSSGALARTLAFGTGQLVLSGSSATIFDVTTATNFTTTGTPYINCTYTGSVGTRTIVTGFTEAQSVGYDIATSGTAGIILSPSATDIVALTGNFEDINLTGFTGTLSNTTRTIYGSLTIPSSGGTFTAGTLVTTFASTTSKTITSNGRTLDFPITFNGVGGSWALQNSLTAGSSRTVTLTAGTLNLNDLTLTTGFFNTSGTGTRTLAFGTGQLALAGNNATIFDVSISNNLTTTGTVYINCTYTGAVGTRTIVTTLSEEQVSVGYSVSTSGTSGIVLSPSATDIVALSGVFYNINLTGFTGTLSNVTRTVYGTWTTPASGGTYTAGTLETIFASSSSRDITGNGRTLDFPIRFTNGGALSFNGSQNISIASDAALNIWGTSGDATFEFWFYNIGTGNNGHMVVQGPGNTNRIWIVINSNQTIQLGTAINSSFQDRITTTATAAANQWHHLAIVIQGGTTKTMYLDGVNVGSSTGALYPGGPLYVGTQPFGPLGTDWFVGYIANLRVVNGVAVYTGNFTPPTAPLSITQSSGTNIAAISGTQTSLLLSASNVHTPVKDSSTRAFSVSGSYTYVYASPFTSPTTWTLQSALTVGSTRTTTLYSGTLDLNNYTLTTGSFNSSAINARTLSFDTGQLALSGSGTTIFDITTATNFSTTGTVYVNCTYASSVGTRTLVTGLSEAQAAAGYNVATSGTTGIVLSPSATDIVALTGNFEDINLTGFIGTLSNTARTIYGNWTNPLTGGTYTAGTNATTFASTSSQTITSNGRTLDFPITFNGVGGSWALQTAFTTGATRTTTLTAGTLNLNNYTYTTQIFSSSGAVARTLAFSTSGQLALVGSGTTIFNVTTATNYSTTGTVYINSTYASSVGTRTFVTGFNEVQADAGYSVSTSGTTGIVLSPSATDIVALTGSYENINLTGFIGTLSNVARTVYGNWTTPASGGTYTAGALATSFRSTGSQTITSNGRTLDFALTFDGVGGTWTLQDNLTIGATRILTWNNGTLDLNNFALSNPASITINGGATGLFTVKNTGGTQLVTKAVAVTHTTGELNLFLDMTFAAYTFTAGTITLNSYTLTCTTFTSTSTTARTFAFGTGNITVTASGACFNMLAAANHVVTGTPNVNITNSTATATSVVPGVVTEAQSLNFIFSGGAYTLTFLATASHAARNVTFSEGWAGVWAATAACTVYGSLSLSATMTLTESLGIMTFGGALANTSKTITTNGKAIPFPITFNGSGSAWTLQDSLAMGITVAKALIVTAGIFDVNQKPVTAGFAGSAMSTNGTCTIRNLWKNTTIPFTLTSGALTLTATLNNPEAVNHWWTGYFLGAASFLTMNFTHTAGTLTLGADVWMNSATTYTWTAGTIALANFELQVGAMVATGATTRIIQFGSSGQISTLGTGTVWNQTTIGTFSYTGTSTINITNYLNVLNNTALGITVVSGVSTVANAQNFNFYGAVGNQGTLTFLATATHTAGNVTFNASFQGTWGATAACTIFGNLTLVSTVVLTSSASVMTFGATSSKTITSSGLTIPFPITFSGVGGTWSLQDALTVGPTLTTSLNNGTLNLNDFVLTTGLFSSTTATARTIAYGTTPLAGRIVINYAGASATVFTTATVTNLTVTGAYPVVQINSTVNSLASNYTVATGAMTEANAMDFWFQGYFTLTFLGAVGYTCGDIDFAYYGNFSGTWAATATGTIYGSVILNASMTLTTSASAMTLGGTSANETFKSNGKAITFPINLNASGATKQLTDAFTMATITHTFTHTNGTLDLNGYTATVGLYTTAVGTKNLTFNSGTLVVAGSGATAFNNAQPTGYTTTDASGTGKISLTSSTAKTFVGGGSTYNCAVSHDGTGILTFTGSSSFRSIASAIAAPSFAFTVATTQTVTSWDANGTAGNLVIINSSVAGTLANISKTGGGSISYVSVRDIAFQPCSTNGSGALPILWAAENSTNRGNNFGIVFEAYDADARTYVISLTSVTSWTIPADWDPSNNTIHLIGGGGGAAGSRTVGGLGGGTGGGGGGYTKILNYSSAAGTVVSTTIGTAGNGGAPNFSGTVGGTTVFGAYSAGGGGAGGYGTGGAAGVGSTYNGGRGGLGSSYGGSGGGGGGGGGAGGPNGAGGRGGDNFVNNGGDTGGGGNGGGTNGSTTAGGNGWLGTGGGTNAGGAASAGTLGTGGGAGPVPTFQVGQPGGSGFDIYGLVGGGGGGGGNNGGTGSGLGGAGGNYGAGGGGAGVNAGASPATFGGGSGAQGLIVIRYYVSAGGGIGAQAGAFFAFF